MLFDLESFVHLSWGDMVEQIYGQLHLLSGMIRIHQNGMVVHYQETTVMGNPKRAN